MFAKWKGDQTIGRPTGRTLGQTVSSGPSRIVRSDALASMVAVAGRGLLWLGLVAWTWWFITRPMGPAVFDSFLHVVDLVFHEAGHLLFRPFGRFMTSLGGSLMQLVVPAACAVALLCQNRDPFGASVAVWWLGQSLLDVAPYIADARALELVLLGGGTGREVEGHDWEAVLGALGWLELDGTLGVIAHGLGIAVMVAGLAWGGVVLRRQLGRRYL